jgi:hypothetical protein
MPRKRPSVKPVAKEPNLTVEEKFVLLMALDRPVPWAQIYCKAVDTLFEKSMLWWHHKDERGPYYSTIIVTKKGKLEYERATKK